MTYLLVKTEKGVHVRKKSAESAENLDAVALAKVATWEAFGRASYDAAGGSMEEVIQAVINEMRGTVFKSEKPKIEVSEAEYKSLLIQSVKKGVSKNQVDALVVIVATKKPTVEEMVAELIER